jgi:hypothetical protein
METVGEYSRKAFNEVRFGRLMFSFLRRVFRLGLGCVYNITMDLPLTLSLGGLELLLPKGAAFGISRDSDMLSLTFNNFSGVITLRPSTGL